MRIAVIGASGVLGRNLVPRLIERSHSVRALLRDPARGQALAAMGAEIVVGDILAPATLPAAIRGCELVINLATAVPRPGAEPDWSDNDRIRREGTANLAEACAACGVDRLVQQSIAMLHAADDAALSGTESWIDEDAPIRTSPATESAADMETLLARTRLDWRIVRGGAFYGPGTGRDAAWRAAARGGTLRLPGNGEGFISLIHVADMASAMIAVALAAAPRSTWIACDDRPVTYRDLFGHIAALEGVRRAATGGPVGLASFRASNRRLRTVLGWRPFYATYRSGIR